jgi:hypothetical protein
MRPYTLTPTAVRTILESFRCIKFEFVAPCFVLHGREYRALSLGLLARWRLVPTSGIGQRHGWWVEKFDGSEKTEVATTVRGLRRLVLEWLTEKEDGPKPVFAGYAFYASLHRNRNGEFFIWKRRRIM